MSLCSPPHEDSPSSLEGITGIILAGGKSSRYGANKAFVEIGGVRLIDRVIRCMKTVFERLILITNTPEEYAYLELPIYGDLIKGLGPLGGIYTGLEVISDEAGFFVACDMPFLNPDLIRHIALAGKGFDAVVPRVDWKIEPLHALYARTCLGPMRQTLSAKEYQIRKFYRRIRIRYMEEEEIRAFDPHLRSFLNVNRPGELEDLAATPG